MPRKIQLKNLRYQGMRIPMPVFKSVAEEMLPEAAKVTRHEQRHGIQTATSLARENCAVDPAFRKELVARCGEKMAGPARQKAAEAGYKVGAVAENSRFGVPTLEDGSIDWITRLARAKERDAITPQPPLCGFCSAPATRKLKAGLRTDQLGDYCDRHDWRDDGRGCTPAVMAMPASAWLP